MVYDTSNKKARVFLFFFKLLIQNYQSVIKQQPHFVTKQQPHFVTKAWNRYGWIHLDIS